MSDDAIAVTPAAPPQQPNESVYQALNAALSATSRGRWFLSEFAKRNRNSESSKMLDAVARIEQVVADPSLAAVRADLLIVRDWAKAARDEAISQIETPERESRRAAAERAARIIREIATSMRAVGNDPRICNILDTQLDSIEAAQRGGDEPSKAAAAGFVWLIARIEELIPAPPASQQPEAPPAIEQPADPEARLAAVTDLAVACATGDPDVTPTAAQIAEDDNLLALIAEEMASPDEEMVIRAAAPEISAEREAPPPAGTIVATLAQPEAPSPRMPPTTPFAVPAPALADIAPDAEAPMEPAPMSLGQSVLAQGLVEPPPKLIRDPFVALKRLTQSEKIALFT